MTAEQLRELAADHLRRSRREQALPERVTDPATLDKLARLFRPTLEPRTPRPKP